MGPCEISIRSALEKDGIMSFAQFMELALYSPGSGYYETHAKTIGRAGDYFTSVSVGTVFGDCLAIAIAQDWALANRGETWSLVEAGAHDGRLALDVLNSLKRRFPQLYESVHYRIVEPSETRRSWQSATLSEHRGRFSHLVRVNDLPKVRGVFLSNELFDAFPVHRFAWSCERRDWRELGVSERNGQLVGCELDSPTLDFDAAVLAAGLSLPQELLSVLPEGLVLELCPAAAAYWKTLANAFEQGLLIAIDYGMGSDEWIRPERTSGTARAYSGHVASSDLLVNPGAQDLTAHVNFGALELAGREVGFRTVRWERQGVFLSSIARDAERTGLALGWDGAELRQFKTLVHPQHLGHSFRVLIQQK